MATTNDIYAEMQRYAPLELAESWDNPGLLVDCGREAIYGEDREMMDIIFGPFFICDCSTPYFGSLNKEQLERYKKQFQNPEHFFRVGGEIKAVPYKPEKDHER